MPDKINLDFEKEVAEFYQSLGVNQGPGDIQYRIILLVLKKNDGKITEFSQIREYTDRIADRGSIGSKMKTVFQYEGLAEKVQRGGYVITDKGRIAANFLKETSVFYKKTNKMQTMLERLP
ncbi:hypothetical protein ACT9XH_04865 [Methanococcoides methylutens]|uniref:hypothetical protein n=1 Tax=Methanococcoides methylutens TaxID=2226 RepID=UPI00404412DD